MPERPARVVLVGFMGSGKSSIGRLVARRLGYRFEDMDRRIEKRAGRTIAAIFRDSGEEAFRELEREEARALPPCATGWWRPGGVRSRAPTRARS